MNVSIHFNRLCVELGSAGMTVIYPDRHRGTGGRPESEPGGLSEMWSRQGGWCCLCRQVQHGRWPSLHMCAPWGPTLCLWWYWSCWDMRLSRSAPEVATCWDLDSRCERVEWMYVKVKKKKQLVCFSFSYIPHDWLSIDIKNNCMHIAFALFFVCLGMLTWCC